MHPPEIFRIFAMLFSLLSLLAGMAVISFWIADAVMIGTNYLDTDGNGYYIIKDL